MIEGTDGGSENEERTDVLSEVAAEYTLRDQRYEAEPDRWLRDNGPIRARNQRWYERVLNSAGLVPLGGRDVLDVGCGRGEFMDMCQRDWGHDGTGRLAGIDQDPTRVDELESRVGLEVVCHSADAMPWPDASFDLVHQSMLHSSLPPGAVREGVFAEMVRVTRPGGYVLWYDFFANPINPHAHGVRWKEIRGNLPGFSVVSRHRVTPPPQMTRAIDRRARRVVDGIERAWVFNLWHLVLLRKW